MFCCRSKPTFGFLCECGSIAFKNRFVRHRSMECAPQSMSDRCLTCVAAEYHLTAIYAPTPDSCLSFYIQLLFTVWLTILTSTYVPPFRLLKKKAPLHHHTYYITGQTDTVINMLHLYVDGTRFKSWPTYQLP